MNIEINDNSIIVEIYNDRKNITCKSNNIIERAKNNPIDIEFIKKHMSKLGNTPFKINNINITNIPNNI